MLTVRVGPSLEALQNLAINRDDQPVRIQSQHFDGWVMVRVRDTPQSASAYFDHCPENTFCIQVVGRFLVQEQQHLTADDIMYGNQFDRPLKLPTGSSVALRFARWFDPGLEADLNGAQPKAFSPLIVTMNRLAVQTIDDNKAVDWPSPHGEPVREDCRLLSMDLEAPKQRRSFFSNPQARRSVDIAPNQVWSMEFSNPYLDFNRVCAISVLFFVY